LHLLKGDQGLGEALPVATLPAVPNLLVLTAGPVPPNPTEILSSARMQRFLDSVLPGEGHPELADVVVLDTPAAASFADAAVLAAGASSTLLVVDTRRCREGQLMRARDALSCVNARVAGVVLNHAGQQAKEVHYYQYDRTDGVVDAPEIRPAVPTDASPMA
jgi:Mrp family chromosome partitioning ATPase